MINLLKEYISLLIENEYRGEHTAPGKDGGSPLHDLTSAGTYPEDIYSMEAARYYGDHGGDGRDHSLVSYIQRFRNRPNKPVKIYRAVPFKKGPDKEIAELEKQKAYILKHGRIPPGVDTPLDKTRYYEFLSKTIERIQKYQLPNYQPEKTNLKIQPGDWVTIERRYAVEHGQAHLKGEYKILSKTVPAKEIYTDGNSLYEWGWEP